MPGSGGTRARQETRRERDHDHATSDGSDARMPCASLGAAPSSSSPDSAATPISTCCVTWLPTDADEHEARHQRADDRADGVGRVDAAHQPRRSPARALATDASASGKLAPQRIAPGSITQSARTRSSWNVVSAIAGR